MKAQHLVNVSGGKDSTATYLLAIESGRPFRAVFADTGNEHEAVYEHIAELPRLSGGPAIETIRADFSRQIARHRAYILEKWPAQGIPQADVDAAAAAHEPTGNPYLDLCISKGRFPSRMAQFCTEELKVLPITLQVVLPMLKAGPVLQWLGIRAEESARRAKQPRLNRTDSGAYLWRPIQKWTLADVWKMHARHGIRPNRLYAMGMGRVGCMPCINCQKGELKAIGELFPEHIDRIERWEAIVAAASKRGLATFFPADKDPLAQEPGVYAGIRTVVDWSTTGRGGRQRQLFFDGQTGAGCSHDLALCETEEAQP